MVLNKYFTKILKILVAQLVLFWATNVLSETMFEAYYIIRTAGVKSGFVIQRYSFDKSTKTFESVYYIRTGPDYGNATESLVAKSNDKFEPISYQYTSHMPGVVKSIDAKFSKDKMTYTLSDGKQTVTKEAVVQKGTFLSTFLAYLMLSKGVTEGKKFTYSAIAEEDATAYNGTAFVQSKIKEKNLEAYVILNEFKGARFIASMTPKGEVLSTKSPVQQLETELIPTAVEATSGYQLDPKHMKLLFGQVPVGKTHQVVATVGAPKPAAPVNTPIEKSAEKAEAK